MATTIWSIGHDEFVMILFVLIALICIGYMLYSQEISLKEVLRKLIVFGEHSTHTTLHMPFYGYKKLQTHVEMMERYQFDHVDSSDEDINMILDDDVTTTHSRRNRRKISSPQNTRYRVYHSQSYTDHSSQKSEEPLPSIEHLAIEMAREINHARHSNTDRTVTNTDGSSEDHSSTVVYPGESVSYEYSHSNETPSLCESAQNV